MDPGESFCCAGCDTASRILHSAGLERFYEERDAYAPRPRPRPRTTSWATAPRDLLEDGTCEVRLTVDGLRCASCVWVTERLLERTPGVTAAQVSYASGRARVRWDPAQVELGAVMRRVESLGYQPRLPTHEERPDRALLLRLGVATFAALNVMLVAAALYAGWLDGMDVRFQQLFRWTTLLLATPVALWCATPFYQGAWNGLRAGRPHMDLPIAIAVITMYAHGVVATLLGFDTYLDSLTMLVALLLAGRVLEARGRRRASEAAETLAARLPASARRWDGDVLTVVPVEDLRVGDRIEVAAGDELPADGRVTAGAGSALMALITGESDPVGLTAGDEVVAGAVLETGALTVRVERVGGERLVERMAAALSDASTRTEPSPASDWAPVFTIATLIVASATFGVWAVRAGVSAALETTVAVLVVACPCALALSRPLAGMAGLGAAARRGVLLRSVDVLLRLARVDVLGVDKTGTVTHGELTVLEARDEDLRIAAGLERASGHPIADAVLAEAAQRGVPVPAATDVVETPGEGIRGRVDGALWQLRSGGPGRVELEGPNRTASLRFGDRVRADSRSAISDLERMGVAATLITGDHERVARSVAQRAGLDRVLAACRPEAKADWVRARRADGARVVFVGDGVNDGPALAAADVGLAMRAGSASSLLVADGVVVSGSLRSLAEAIRAARLADAAIRRSQLRSVSYNILAVGAAAAGLINPLVAALLMPLSSAMVIAGALGVERRMRRSSV